MILLIADEKTYIEQARIVKYANEGYWKYRGSIVVGDYLCVSIRAAQLGFVPLREASIDPHGSKDTVKAGSEDPKLRVLQN